MLAKTKALKKNPLSKAQNKLLRVSLKNLLGNGLIQDQQQAPAKKNDLKTIVLKNALSGVVLE
jgi:hypothetical protein